MKLDRSFYTRDTITVARELLGCFLVHKTLEGTTKGRIIEVEAYLGPEDKGAHSYHGRHTPTMDPLYNKGGFAYVFQLHGYNYCLNVVSQKLNVPQAVLIRGIEPYEGIKLMAKRRNIDLSNKNNSKYKNLTNGPSKLCQAFDIDTSINGIDLCGNELFITIGKILDNNNEVISTPRVNIDYAGEFKDKPWRFLYKDNPFVSHKYKLKN